MLHSFLFAPFTDSAAETQFEALHALLQPLAAAEAPWLLLGNLSLDDSAPIDAVVVRPAGVVLLQFVARGGSLHLPPGQAPWQLSGQPLTGQGGAANPYAQFQRQQRALAAWLTAQPGLGLVRPEALAGIVLFGQPVTFGSEVETRLNVLTGADQFQLLSSLPHLPRRLQQLRAPISRLAPAALDEWLRHLHNEAESVAEANEAPAPAAEDDFWTQKARQLWRWLGAEDLPPDLDYGSYPPDPVAAGAAEKARLEQIRQQVRTELEQHTQALTAREVEREQTIRHLQQQLTAAQSSAPSSAELQARLAEETREKAAMQEALQLARVETAARNRELDARIAQLETLIQQLQARPAAPAPPTPAQPLAAPTAAPAAAPVRPAAATPSRPVARPVARRYATRRLQPWRVAAVVAVVIGLIFGGWGGFYLYQHRNKPTAPRREVSRQPEPEQVEEAATEEPPTEEAPSALEERLNNPVIDSTGATARPTPADSVFTPSEAPSDSDSI